LSPARAVFLDRDGVITQNVYYAKWGETEGPMRPEDVVILPGALDAMKTLAGAGFTLFLVSNQGAFAKGKTSLASLVQAARFVSAVIRGAGVILTEEYYSFTHPDGVTDFFSGSSLERKPNPYFLKIAEASYDLDMKNSWMVGDRTTDIKCGRLAGCRTALVTGDSGDAAAVAAADISAATFLGAAEIIVSIQGG